MDLGTPPSSPKHRPLVAASRLLGLPWQLHIRQPPHLYAFVVKELITYLTAYLPFSSFVISSAQSSLNYITVPISPSQSLYPETKSLRSGFEVVGTEQLEYGRGSREKY